MDSKFPSLSLTSPPNVEFIWEIWPFDLLVPLVVKIPLNLLFILVAWIWYIPVHLFNFIPNTLSLAAFWMLGLFNAGLIVLEMVGVATWILITGVYVWSVPDIIWVWATLILVALLIVMIDQMTGGTFDFEKIGPGGWLCDDKAVTWNPVTQDCDLVIVDETAEE